MEATKIETCQGGCENAAKWGAVVDDLVIAAPRRVVSASVIKAQASVPDDFVLVRDHNSPNDVVLRDEDQVDLAHGNVFYRLKRCEVQPANPCHDAAKLAFIVDDRAEITTRGEQNGKMLLELFGLALHTQLVRDFEGSHDHSVALDATVKFVDGPVFYSRQFESGLKITVNARVFTEHEGVESSMTGLAIATLVYPDKPSETRVVFLSDNSREVSLTETVHIKGCESFEVVRKEVTGGYEQSRIDRELSVLRSGGQQMTFVEAPVNAIVYHGLRARRGIEVTTTDVLVPIPSGYPGQMIDLAYLTNDSPLFGKVKGEAQEPRIVALGRTWRQVSYHPHNGGGAPAWNPTVHGFHTYLGELISWLSNQK
ncbi:MAG: hypothetical protein JWM11_2441 [Planctomycetaceae bacterium]|nr:hypothetical protein [Planctomycetaceae bacterium]